MLNFLLLLFSLYNILNFGLMICISMPMLSITILFESMEITLPSQFATLGAIQAQVFEHKFQYIGKAIAGYVLIDSLHLRLFSADIRLYYNSMGGLVGRQLALGCSPKLRSRQTPPYQTIADFASSTGCFIETSGFLSNQSGLGNLLLANETDLFAFDDAGCYVALVSQSYWRNDFGYAYMDSGLNCKVYRPTLSAESSQTMYAQAKIMAVNAAFQQKEAAIRFVEFCAENLPIKTKYEMIPPLSTPVENPDYAARTVEVNADLQQWKQQYAQRATTEEQDTLAGLIAGVQDLIHSLENNRFILSAESIAVYRGMGEQLKIPYDSAYLGSSGDFESLFDVV